VLRFGLENRCSVPNPGHKWATYELHHSDEGGGISSVHALLCWSLTRTEVVVFEHVALKAAAGREVLGAVGHRTASPQGAGVLLMLLGVDVQAAAC